MARPLPSKSLAAIQTFRFVIWPPVIDTLSAWSNCVREKRRASYRGTHAQRQQSRTESVRGARGPVQRRARVLVRWRLVEDDEVAQRGQGERATQRWRGDGRTRGGGAVDNDAGEVFAQHRMVLEHGPEVGEVGEGGEDEGGAHEGQGLPLVLVVEDAGTLDDGCDAAVPGGVLVVLAASGELALAVA